MYTILASTEESVQVIKDAGNIMFFVLLVALVIAVFVICWIFMRNKKFKIKERERLLENGDDYTPPTVVYVTEEHCSTICLPKQTDNKESYDGSQTEIATQEKNDGGV